MGEARHDGEHTPAAGGRRAEDSDVEDVIAQRRAARRRGTPAGREPAEGTERLRRLLLLTVGLLAASALVIAGALLLG